MGRVNPTSGFDVAPMTVMASEMLGMATASTKQVVMIAKVIRKFYILFIVFPGPRYSSSIVSLTGMRQRGEARMTPVNKSS